MARWRSEHPEEARERVRKSLLKHPETVARQYANFLARKDAAPEEIRNYRRKITGAWKEKHPGLASLRTQLWRTVNPEKKRLNESRRRARKLGISRNDFTKEQWDFALAYWQGCAVCGRQEGLFWFLAKDHWIPLSAPECPGNTAENILPLCHTKKGEHESCNNTKHNRDPVEWLFAKLGARKAKAKLKQIILFFETVKAMESSGST